jgi:nucleotide-binding universal stress UspA family protein
MLKTRFTDLSGQVEKIKMNRIILGLDQTGSYEAAERLLVRLGMKDAEVDVFHAAEAPVFYSDMTLPSTVQLMADALQEELEIGRQLCEKVSHELRESGLATGEPVVVAGYPAAEILDFADRSGAALIAVGGTRKGALRAFFAGSVSRALVIGAHQSLLVGKGQPAAAGPVRAVFATDHSAYADQCIGELLALAPQGLSHLTVVTSYPKEFVHTIRPFLPEFVLDPAEWIEKSLRERNEQVLSALAPLGCELDARVMRDTPASSIPAAMKETGADLLILGAQGHGFVERLSLGSTSFHQVVAEPHSVLVLRVPRPKPV